MVNTLYRYGIHAIEMLSFTNFYTASIIRLIKGCDWEEELAVLCLHSYSTKKTLPLVILISFQDEMTI